MNKEKLSWGLILLFVGGILLLKNLDIIHFYWRSVFNMWPVILIVIGVNLLVPRKGMGNAISIVVTVAALAFLAYWGTLPPQNNWWESHGKRWSFERNEDQSDDGKTRRPLNNKFVQEYSDSINVAHLNIKGGAIDYEIDGFSDNLFEADTRSTFGTHILETSKPGHIGDSVTNLTFRMENVKKGNWRINVDENLAKIKLNRNPTWHISLDMGAGAAEFDLTNYKIASLNMKGGAASFEAKLGMPLEESVINVESGVASIELGIPKAAACRIVVSSGLSSKDFPGFAKQGDGSYTTDGYENALNKFHINLKGGLSSFVVERYD